MSKTSIPIKIDAEILHKLTPDQIVIFYEAFKLFDRDNDYTITRTEIVDVFNSLGQQVSKEQIDDMLSQFDADGNGQIDFNEFLKMMIVKSQAQLDTLGQEFKEDEFKAAFDLFDKNKNGKIDAEELKGGMQALGEEITMDEAQGMLKEADVNGDGELDFEEFKQCLQK